ncbi:hypothetical protein BDV26DRAFT_293617 [Aspergillus bertholletiae]|uniref:Uncharacterized protein n=1 Tax=Aspergillus bertholletiae TaxID=1226010 RepID=A0A5N7B4T7_9EURO|nr:hypothetical protein BDV26DRAFT_293617 [Aspergillus bertholletiae]
MNSISVDTELMTQYVPAQGISETSHLIALRDENHQLMILTLGYLWQDDKRKIDHFYLLKKGASGMYEKHDLGTNLGLQDDYKAAAIQATQDPSTDLIYLALAIEKDSTHSGFFLLEPLSPQDITSSSLQNHIIRHASSSGETTIPRIVEIFLGTPSKDVYPLVILIYKPLSQLGTEDVMAVTATQTASRWNWDVNKYFSLPSNATKLLALQPISIDWFDEDTEDDVKTPAVAFLYTQGSETQLNISALTTHNPKFHLVCPPGSRTLAGVSTEDGYTDLLVGGPDLYYFRHDVLTKKNAEGKRVLRDSATKFDCTNELYVAQSRAKQSISIWAENANQGISYLIPDSLTQNTKTPVPLIPDKQGGRFTAFKAASGQMEQYIYHSGEKEVSILEMDPSSRFWKSVPLMIETMDQMVEFPAHVTHVAVRDSSKRPLPNKKLRLESKDRVSLLVNGKAVVSASGSNAPSVTTDSRGCLSITTPTGSIFSESLILVDPEKSVSCDIDPNTKVKDALRRVSKKEELLKDDILLKHVGKDPQHVEALATAIGHMMNVVDHKPITETEYFAGTVALDSSYSIIDKAIDLGHEFINWVDKTYNEAKEWLIRTIKDGYEFFIDFGEKAYRWVVRTVEEAWNGIKLVFNKILQVAKDIIEWIGWIFEWDDIIATHTSLVHLTSSALNCAPDYVQILKNKSDVFLNTLTANLAHWGNIDVPNEVTTSTPDKVPLGESHSAALTSSKVNWVINLFHHGGGAQGLTFAGGDSGSSNKLQQFWDKLIVKAAQDGDAVITGVGKAFVELFKTGSWAKVEDVLKHLSAEVMVKAVDIIKTLVDGFLDVLTTILEEFKSLLEKKISIPVISQLYEAKVGSPLTVLDGLALLVAFPTTVLHKMIYKKTPVDATKTDYKTLISGQPLSSTTYSLDCLFGTTHLFSQIFMQITDAIGITLGANYYSSALISVEDGAGLWDEYGRRIKNVFSVIGVVVGVPFATLPHMDLRWSSWALAAAKAGTSILLRYITSGAKEKIFAVVEGVFGTASFGLIIAVKVLEFKASEDTPGKTWTTFDMIAATATEVGMITGDVARFLSDAESRGYAETVALVLDGVSFGVIAAKLYIHASTTRYNGVLNM